MRKLYHRLGSMGILCQGNVQGFLKVTISSSFICGFDESDRFFRFHSKFGAVRVQIRFLSSGYATSRKEHSISIVVGLPPVTQRVGSSHVFRLLPSYSNCHPLHLERRPLDFLLIKLPCGKVTGKDRLRDDVRRFSIADHSQRLQSLFIERRLQWRV